MEERNKLIAQRLSITLNTQASRSSVFKIYFMAIYYKKHFTVISFSP